MQHALHLIEGTELPVIGALNGRVIGLGLELALAFDLRVAAEDLQISIPEPVWAWWPTLGARRG